MEEVEEVDKVEKVEALALRVPVFELLIIDLLSSSLVRSGT